MEDRDDRRAVALVEVDQQLHRPRPGGGGRDGRSARRGRGPAPPGRRPARAGRAGARRATARARRGRAGGRPRPARSPRRSPPGRPGAGPRIGSSCGSRPRATTSSTARRERQAAPAAARPRGAGRSRRGRAARAACRRARPRPRSARRARSIARSSVDLPAPFGPIERDPLPGLDREVDVAHDAPAAVGDGRRRRASIDRARSQLVPGRGPGAGGRGRTARR